MQKTAADDLPTADFCKFKIVNSLYLAFGIAHFYIQFVVVRRTMAVTTFCVNKLVLVFFKILIGNKFSINRNASIATIKHRTKSFIGFNDF